MTLTFLRPVGDELRACAIEQVGDSGQMSTPVATALATHSRQLSRSLSFQAPSSRTNVTVKRSL